MRAIGLWSKGITSRTLCVGNIVLVTDDACTTEWAKDQRHSRCTLRKGAPTYLFMAALFRTSPGTIELTALYSMANLASLSSFYDP
jgi:hypothetical protein